MSCGGVRYIKVFIFKTYHSCVFQFPVFGINCFHFQNSVTQTVLFTSSGNYKIYRLIEFHEIQIYYTYGFPLTVYIHCTYRCTISVYMYKFTDICKHVHKNQCFIDVGSSQVWFDRCLQMFVFPERSYIQFVHAVLYLCMYLQLYIYIEAICQRTLYMCIS